MTIHAPKGFHIVVGWISVVSFGLGGLYILYGTLKERLTGRPVLTITDEAVIMEGMKQAVIRFADVESFEYISTTCTGMKAQDLCDLLNERLNRK